MSGVQLMLPFKYKGTISKEDLEWALWAIMYFINYDEIEKRTYESDFGGLNRKKLKDILSTLDSNYW